MNFFGIQLTPGHFILMAVGTVIYDAVWTFAFSNRQSDWWFERVQGFLKAGIYTGFVGLVTLIAYIPWPYNLVLVLSIVTSIGFIVIWLRKKAGNLEEAPAENAEEI